VDVKEILATYHVVKGEMQYNLLGQSWIENMESVPYALHKYLKYLHMGVVYCIVGDLNPLNHCNSSFSPKFSHMLCGFLFLITILVNDHPESTSSHSLEPSSLTLPPIQYTSSS